MLYGQEERKYYRFPSQSSILDYEMDYEIYCPSNEDLFHGKSISKNPYKERNSERNKERNKETGLQ